MGKVFVTKRQEGWAVITSNSQRAVKIHDTQECAINHGKEIAQNNSTQLIIQGKDNKFRTEYSYGNDPKNIPG